MLARVPDGAHVVALLETGKPWSTKELAAKLEALDAARRARSRSSSAAPTA